jgi:hypothetical protein
MHSFSRSLLGLGALTLAGCGAPAELDESRFPGVNDTGYVDGFGPIGGAGAPPNSGTGGTGSTLPVGGGGGNLGQGGSAPVMMAGNGSVASGGSPPVGQGGSAQGGSASTGGGAQTGNDSCPDDITELFARPGAQGGCDGPGCHSAGGQRPDLISPGLEERLLDVASSAQCRGIPYVSAGESLLEGKIAGNPAPCGLSMPLGGAMTEPDKQCVIEWIAEVTGG